MTEPRKRILCADDEESNRDLYSGFLESFLPPGYELKFFEDGSALERELQQGSSGIALVVTDNTMPGVKGIEIIEKYARTEEFRQVPFVMISGEKNVQPKAIEYGAAASIQKPIRLKDFRDTIKRALGINENPTESSQ